MPMISSSRQRQLKASSRLFLAVALATGLCMAAPAHAGSDAYQIMPQTHLRIAVVEWLATTGDYKEWTPLNGEYVVSADGTISVPMVGEMNVGDRTSGQVAADIGQALKKITGLSQPPVASVQVLRYPMVYVTGAVERPGEVEFRPGMTVKQAVAMAGGRQRRNTNTGEYNDTQQISYAGELNRMEMQLKQFGARRARLIAELNDKPSIDFPPELVAAPDGSPLKQIVNGENVLFSARAGALRSQIEAANDLETLLTNEISVLEEKMTSQDRQVQIAQQELDDISKLVDTKILTTSRKTSLERIVAELQGDKLDMVLASMQAKQRLNETQREVLNLKGQRKSEVGQLLQATDADIEDTKLKRMTTLQLLQIAGASLTRDQSLKAVDLQPMEYWVTHAGGSGEAEQIAETASVDPSDVLDVRFNVSGSVGGAVISSIAGEQAATSQSQ